MSCTKYFQMRITSTTVLCNICADNYSPDRSHETWTRLAQTVIRPSYAHFHLNPRFSSGKSMLTPSVLVHTYIRTPESVITLSILPTQPRPAASTLHRTRYTRCCTPPTPARPPCFGNGAAETGHVTDEAGTREVQRRRTCAGSDGTGIRAAAANCQVP